MQPTRNLLIPSYNFSSSPGKNQAILNTRFHIAKRVCDEDNFLVEEKKLLKGTDALERNGYKRNAIHRAFKIIENPSEVPAAEDNIHRASYHKAF